MSNNLKWEAHVNSAYNKANKKIGVLKHCFRYYNEKSTRLLYTSLIRPQIEYANVIWHPYLKKDIDKLESIQHRSTKKYCLKNLSYEERIKKLKLTTLEKRRKRGDLIQMFKIIKNIDEVNWHNPPDYIEENRSRRQDRRYRIRRQITRTTSRYEFLYNRIVNEWNALPQEVIESNNVCEFKNKLDKVF